MLKLYSITQRAAEPPGKGFFMKDFAKKVVVPACIYFACITVPFALLIYAIYGGSGSGGTLSALRTAMFFVFSLVFSTANALIRAERPALWIRVIIHALLTGVGFWLFMLLPAELEGSGVFTGLLVYFVIYAIVAAIVLSMRAQTKKRENKQSEYTAVFKKDSK